MKVIIPASVERELFEITLHIAQDDLAAADRVAAGLEARCLSLAEHPDRGAIIARRRGSEIRRVIEGQYLILYSVADDVVRIHRIRHGARSPRLLLKGLDLP